MYHAIAVILCILCTRIVVQRLYWEVEALDCQSSVWLKSCMGAEAAEASTVMRELGQELFFSPFLTLGYGILYSPNPNCALS